MRVYKNKATKNEPIEEYDDDNDDEEEEEEPDENVDNLINDDFIEEDDESIYLRHRTNEPTTATKRHYSDDDDDDELDEDDLELLEENTGRKFRKDKPKSKRRRLVVESDDDDEDERSAVVSETVERHNRRIEEPLDEEYEPNYEDEDDDDDFIDDDDDGGHQPGPPKNRVKGRKLAELSEAYEVFGNDFTMDDEDEYEQNYDEETEEQDAPQQLIEPAELERAHLTARDIQIRESGLPERFQLRNIPVCEGDNEELQEEAEWIYKYAFKIPTLSRQTFSKVDKNFNDEICVVLKIFEALKLIRQMNLEVPFIAFYRKEVVQPELSITDLWRIFHWDGKWMQMRIKKQNLLRLFENFKNFQEENSLEESLPSSFRRLTDNDFDSLRTADTVEKLKDISDHFNLYYSKDVVKMKSRSAQVEYGVEYESGHVIKQSKVNSGYNQCVNAGLIDLANKYGLRPEQFAENMRDNYQRHEVKQEFVSPVTLATDYLKGYFCTPEEVLKGANCIVATQIANDPIVRSCLRNIFHERCMISVKPTAKGINVIDENHPCYGFRYLKDKPVRDLIDDQYLIINNAEGDNLLKVNISIDSNIYRSNYLDEIKPHYEKNEFSDIVQDWNKLRENALEKAFKDILYPIMTREMKNKLLEEAKEFVIRSCRQKIYRWLEVSAYQSLDDYCEEDEIEIMGIAYSDTREEPSVAVTIDKNGQVKETLILNHLWEWNGKKKDEDFDRIYDFVKSRKPIVIAVGSDSTKVLLFINDLKNKLKGKKLGKINVELVDNELAKVYALSKRAENDLKDYSLKHRQAISIARRIQDPLIEFSQLCNLNEDILTLRFHPLQDYIDKDTLLENLYQEFVNRVNEVGVDINRCIEYPHTENLIQFVCGLGPRKGFHMLKLLKREDLKFLNRADLVSEPLRLGQSVYINCAGFLKIDTKAYEQFYDNDTVACIIDGSRIHPESYRYARKMAGDALDYEDPEYENQDQEDEYFHQVYTQALEEIVDEPRSLQELQLEAFAEELEAKKGEKKLITLNDIRSELTNMYKDFRTPYRSPDDPEMFHMLTKETPQTFYIGKLVSCKVVGIAYSNKGNKAGQPVGVKTYLDCGVRGFIPIAMLADHRVNHPEEVVKINMMLTCRITKIDIVKFQVELTSKYSRISNNREIVNFDKYFDFAGEAEEINNAPINKVVTRQGYVKRIVSHPCFQNIDHIACQKQMESLEQGEAIIRPSSKEANRLTLTWKVGDGVMQIVDIWEEGKANPSSIGKKLIIGNESFEDLDEIIARMVQPMASFARDLINYKYFKNINAENMDDETFIGMILVGEKRASPNRIPYCFTLSKKFPGKFIMSYLPRNTPKHDYVTATPDGLRLRGQMFNNLPNLLKWFKENC